MKKSKMQLYAKCSLTDGKKDLLTNGCLLEHSASFSIYTIYYIVYSIYHTDSYTTIQLQYRFSKDIETTDDKIPEELIKVLRMLLFVSSACVAIAIVTPLILIVLPILLILLFLLQRLYLQTSRQVKRLESATKSPIYSLFGEMLQGIVTIRAFRQQKTFLKKCQWHVDENGRPW